MRSSFLAIALCAFAAMSVVAHAAQAPDPAARPEHGQVVVPGQDPVRAQSGLGLTGTTATDGQEQVLPMDDGLPEVTRAAASAKPSEEQPRHTGSAMLLAALAVMMGIVLRRYGASVR